MESRRQEGVGEAAAAAELGCPASLAELQLLTELLALLEPPPPLPRSNGHFRRPPAARTPKLPDPICLLQ